jgi:CRISPR-associated endonuclease Cas1
VRSSTSRACAILPNGKKSRKVSHNSWAPYGAQVITTQRLARDRASRTIILAGYGTGIRVERDALVVTEGHTHNPQNPTVHVLYRGMHDVRRIVCLDPQGSLSFPAVRWCAEQEITLTLLDRSGALLATFTPEAKADVRLRRAQYLAQTDGRDVTIAQQLVLRKVEAQWTTLAAHPELPGAERAQHILSDALTWLRMPTPPPWLESLNMVRTYEGRAASAYFLAWQGLTLRWARLGARLVPPHWLTIRPRNSPLSHNGMPRHAVDPTNAILNYAYGILEGQCRQALAAQGFDLACGFLHADKVGRESLVYDLMELGRARVDHLVLGMLKSVTFHKGDFTLISDGACRLHPQLARAVVASCRLPQIQIDEHAKWLASQL